jgi:hypothetical protein
MAALTGCTAGQVIAADGSNLNEYPGISSVTFQNTSTQENYTVRTSGSGDIEFSFDPYAPASSTNGPYIPAGHYTVAVNLCRDANPNHCEYYADWTGGFDIAYNHTCTDTTTKKQVPCSLFRLVRCLYPQDYNNYRSLCTGVTVSGDVTTVGLLPPPPAAAYPF